MGAPPRSEVMSRVSRYMMPALLAILLSHDLLAASYQEGLAPPGLPASAFPKPARPVADIVTDIWRDEKSRDQAGEAERVMNLLGVKPALVVADIGAGSGYYTVRLARRVGPMGHVFAEDVVPEYLERLARRVASEGLAGTVTVVRGDPHDPRLPPGSIDLALLVHMYHEVQSPYAFLWHAREGLKPDGEVILVDSNRPVKRHGMPPATLTCEFAALGMQPAKTALLTSGEDYMIAFRLSGTRPAPDKIKACNA